MAREEISGRNHSGQIEALHVELEELKALRTELQARWEKERMLVKQIRILQNELEKRAKSPEREEKGEAGVTVELLPPALHLEELTREIIRLEADLKAIQGDDPMVPIDVDSRVIASVVSGWTGIPVGKMLTNDIHTILNLRQKLAEQIIGQPRALDTICRRLQAARANLSDPGKPVGVFLLVGTSGVGKTETAIALAELLYGGERNMVVVNMSEYQEAHTISALKGAPPGYVGYGTGGILTEAVRRNPYTLVLLDEAEKAHSDVKNLFYQVFDKGVLEDAEGAMVDFRNTIILLTCNLEAETMIHACAAARRRDVGFLAERLRPALLKHFTPAFLGRLVVVPYQPLGEDEIGEIVKLKLAKIRDRFWENHGANLSYDERVVAAIAARCTEVDSGARNVDHILTHTLLPKLSEQLLGCMALGEIFSGIHVSLDRAKNFVLQAMISPPPRAHPSRASRGGGHSRKKRGNEIQRAKDE